jgi:hypothetical protein
VHFSIVHEFDARLDAIELAMMSPELGPLLGDILPSLESVQATEHHVDENEFRRVWRFQARAPLKILSGYNITRDMMTWDEHSVYRRRDHTAAWYVIPRAESSPDAAWRKHFGAEGSYQLDPLSDGRTRRTVTGDIAVNLKLIGALVERIAVGELRKAYDAEASALRRLCSLA